MKKGYKKKTKVLVEPKDEDFKDSSVYNEGKAWEKKMDKTSKKRRRIIALGIEIGSADWISFSILVTLKWNSFGLFENLNSLVLWRAVFYGFLNRFKYIES